MITTPVPFEYITVVRLIRIQSRARAFSQPRQKERVCGPWKKCIARGTMGSHNERRGEGEKKERTARMILSMQPNPPRFRCYVLFFPKERITLGKGRLSANFCRNDSSPHLITILLLERKC